MGNSTQVVHPPKPRPTATVHFSVAPVGDDSVATAVRLNAARQAGSRKLEVPEPGQVGPVAFPESGPLRVEVTPGEPCRVALDVTAFEEYVH